MLKKMKRALALGARCGYRLIIHGNFDPGFY